MKILLIEDDQNDIDYVSEVLSDCDITVSKTIPTSPIEEEYELIIIDLFLNGEKCISFLNNIKGILKVIPSIIISSGKLDELHLNEIPADLNAMLVSKGPKYKETLFYYMNLIRTQPDFEEMTDYKTLFLDIVHDLRNDLGYSTYYDAFNEEGFDSAEEELTLLRNIQRSSKFAYSRLQHLSEFLNIGTDKFGSLEDAYEMIVGSGFIEDNIDNIKLEGCTKETLPFIPTFFLSVILKNFIENSCKYAKPGQNIEIKVGLEKTESSYKFNIVDNSGGMPEEITKNLFKKKQASDTGLGIGLIILNRVITSFKGSIKIDSKDGIGTNVLITFPF